MPIRLEGRPGDRAQAAAANFEGAVQANLHFLIAAHHLPGVLGAEPVIRLLVLPAVPDALFEEAVIVSQAVAHGRKVHGRGGFHETGRQAPQPAVTQRGIGFLLQQVDPIEVLVLDGVLYCLDRAEDW